MLEVLRRYPRGVFTAMGLRFAENIMYYLVVTFSITYLVVNEVDVAEILGYMVIAHIVHMLVIPPIGGARRPDRPQAGVLHRRRARRHLGLLRLPDVRHEEPGRHPAGDLHRPDHPRVHVRVAAGDHERDVPDPDALLGRLARLPGHLDRRGLARSDHRRRAAARYGSWVPVAIYLAIAAAITLVAVISLRETKGSSLHELDRIDQERLAEMRRPESVRA